MKRNSIHFLFTFFMGLMLLSSAAIAQTTIRGNVVDDTGESLIGANIIVKGTSDGDVTDFDGNFTVTTSQAFPFTLVFSYTGYTSQEIEVTSNAPVNVTLVEGILSDEVIISASRRREKVQEAPASISVITARKLESTAQATDPTRNLVSTAGVQIQQQSANRINISMRGGAGLFGTSVFPILDYRSLVGPGIGTFQSDAAGLSNIDLQRIEVVRGPGSALYGPGVTQGVVHFISKNPIDFPGTTVEVFGGELNTFGGSIRHATKVSDKFGFKINATYRQGNEFVLDPNDPDDALQIAKFFQVDTDGDGVADQARVVQPAISNGIVDVFGTPEVLLTQQQLDPDGDGNMMSDEWDNLGINATLEFRPKDNLSIVTSGGYNDASSVFYNEQGEGLAQAKEYWAQARVQAGGLFGQVFMVANDGGAKDNPTFLYQTGNRSSVGRTQLEAQLQYNFDTPSFLDGNWTAGFDYRFAGQDTENLVYGRNEDDDDFSVVGGYIQGKLKLHDKLDLVVAGRYDQFNFIDDGAFAPRAALVFKPDPAHTFRASYNRANSTVSNLQLNIDFPLSVLSPTFDIWLYGNKTTQTFENAQTEWLLSPALNGLNQLPLGVAYGAVAAPVSAGISAALLADPMTAPLEPLVAGILAGVDPNALGFFSGPLSAGFNIFDGSPLGLVDAPISAISTLDVLEVGYKGLIKNKLGVTLDVYYSLLKNSSQFTAISPAYRLTNLDLLGGELGTAVAAQVGPQFIGALVAQGQPQAVAEALWAQFQPQIVGAYAAGGGQFADGIAGLPFHATTPTDQVPDNGVTHLAAGYRTFDERDYLGMDLGLEYYFTNDLSAFFNYSWVSDIEFMQKVVGFEDGPSLPTYLNIPKNKFRTGLNYTPELGFRGSISFQHDDSYFASAGQFSGDTEVRNLVDASVGYKFDNGLAIDVSATNLFNNEYRYLPNMPKIGRRALAKVVYTFGQGGSEKKKVGSRKIDTDGDGIADHKDRCPDIAGVRKYKGCPMSEADMAAAAAAEAKAKAEAAAAAAAAEEARLAAEAKAKAEADAKAAEEARLAAEAKAKAEADAKAEEARLAAEAKAKADAAAKAAAAAAAARDAEVSRVFGGALTGIQFRTGQSSFTSSSYAIMDQCVTVMNQYPNMNVTIEGHTDSQGGSATNQKLSQKRADAVMAYLVSKGISGSRLSSVGYGEAQPIADNRYKAGRDKNRRVVFVPSYR